MDFFFPHGYLPLILAFSLNLNAQDHSDTRREIEKIILYDTEIDFSVHPGFIVGIVDEDSTIILSFGNTEDNPASIPGKSLLYELGGLSKIFTAWLIRILAMEDLLSLDDKVNDHLPAMYRNKWFDTIKISHLLTHTSRLPKLPAALELTSANPVNRYALFPKEKVLSSWAGLDTSALENVTYLYSHFNYALLEIVIEQATSAPFEEVLREKIWSPLKMHRTTISFSDKDLENLAPGYDRAGRRAEPWEFASFAGSEGIKSNTEELCFFLSYVLNYSDNLTSQAFYGLLQHPYHIPGSKKSYVAEAWHLFENKNYYPVYLHSGKTTGHGALITFVPQTKTAVVILSKSTHTLDGLGNLILRMVNYNWKRKSNEKGKK